MCPPPFFFFLAPFDYVADKAEPAFMVICFPCEGVPAMIVTPFSIGLHGRLF